jgi:hypothetical protein
MLQSMKSHISLIMRYRKLGSLLMQYFYDKQFKHNLAKLKFNRKHLF